MTSAGMTFDGLMDYAIPKLQYLPGDRFCPVHEVQTVTAVPFAQIDTDPDVHLEGINFDRNLDIYLCNVFKSKVVKLDMETQKVSDFFQFDDPLFKPTAVKFHRDGRMFVAGVDLVSPADDCHGGIYEIDPAGKEARIVFRGLSVDDMVFDSAGGIYFTNFTGSPTNPAGSIDYITPDLKEHETFISGLAGPNGITFSTDESILWFTETNRGVLHRYVMSNDNHSTTPYHATGFYGPDSCSVDADDNLYVAMARQGRVLVFNRNGFPIGQILTPHRDEGALLGTTHPMVHPDREEVYITVHDVSNRYGANLFVAGSFAKGNRNAYQFR